MPASWTPQIGRAEQGINRGIAIREPRILHEKCIRPGNAAVVGRCAALVKGYVNHYNNIRLNSAIGYITPNDMFAGHQQEIQADRDRKLEAARERRKNRRQRIA